MNMWLLLILLSFNTIKTNWAEPKITPKVAAAALKGDSLWLNCSDSNSTSSLNWMRLSEGSVIPEHIYNPWSGLSADYRRGGRHSVDQTVKTCYLKIQNISINDAGIYICMDNDDNRVQVQLVVLDSPPFCHSNISLNNVLIENDCNLEPDYIKLNCSVAYYGNQPPYLEWRNSANFEVKNSSVVTISSSKNMITQSLIVRASSRLDRTNFMCRVAGVPRYGCATQDISTLYFYSSRKHMTVSKNKYGYVSCNANTTSQSCDYRWRVEIPESENPVEFSQQTINLKAIIIEDASEFESLCCYAKCNIRGYWCKSAPMNLTLKIEDEGDGEIGSGIPIDAIFLIPILVSCLVVEIPLVSICFYCVIRCRRKTTKNRGRVGREQYSENHELSEIEKLKPGGIELVQPDAELLEINGHGKMSGVAWSDNKIYVLCEEPKRVRVFRDMKPFKELREDGFEISEIGEQLDMGVISNNNSKQCIIISDWQKKCLWIFTVPDKNSNRQNTDGRPGKMWRKSYDKLLIVVKRGKDEDARFSLDVYSLVYDVSRERSVSLSEGVKNVWHAVESSKKTFIISHENRTSPHRWLVSELSDDGQNFIRTFDPTKFSGAAHLIGWRPFNLAIDANDRVYVGDPLKKTIPLLRLDGDQISLCEKQFDVKHHIKRLGYASEKKQLIVGQYSQDSQDLKLFITIFRYSWKI